MDELIQEPIPVNDTCYACGQQTHHTVLCDKCDACEGTCCKCDLYCGLPEE